MKNYPILTFLQRTWMLLAFTILANYLSLWNRAFVWVDSGARDQWGNIVWTGHTLADICGAVIYLPGIASMVYFVALLLIHLHFRETIDADINDGSFVAYWKAAPSDLKLKLIFAAFIGIIFSMSLIGMALCK